MLIMETDLFLALLSDLDLVLIGLSKNMSLDKGAKCFAFLCIIQTHEKDNWI